MSKYSGRFDYDDLAKLFGLPDMEEINEQTWEYVADAQQDAYEQGLRTYESEPAEEAEEAAEELGERARDEAETEVYGGWRNAVEAVAENELGEVGLGLRKAGDWDFKIVPAKDWKDAAAGMMDLVNGIGPFYFANLREFLDSGPYTPRQAVFAHLGHIRRRFEVYGDISPRNLYDQYI